MTEQAPARQRGGGGGGAARGGDGMPGEGAASHIVLLPTSFASFEQSVREVGDRAVWRVSTAKHGNGVRQLRDHDPETFWQSDGQQPHLVDITFKELTPLTHVAIHLQHDVDDSYTPHAMSVRAGTHAGDLADVASMTFESPKGWVVVALHADAIGPVRPSRRNKQYAHLPAAANAAASGGGAAAADGEGPRAADMGSSGVHVLNRFAPEHVDAAAAAAPVPQLIRPSGGSILPGGRAHGVPMTAPAPLYATQVQVRVTENFQNGRDCHVRGVKVFGPLDGPTYDTPEFEWDVALR